MTERERGRHRSAGEGMRHVEIGQAQARHYPADRPLESRAGAFRAPYRGGDEDRLLPWKSRKRYGRVTPTRLAIASVEVLWWPSTCMMKPIGLQW